MNKNLITIQRAETVPSVSGLVAYPETLYFFKKLHYERF